MTSFPTTVPEISTWRGIYPASLTMFDARGAVDVDATVAHVERLLEQGAHGIVLSGTSGEFISMTRVEREELTRHVAASIGGRVPLIVGSGAFSTAETIALSEDAMNAGASAVLVILPYYQRPSRREVMAHFKTVASATGAPLFVYNNPTNSGTDPLGADDLAELESEANVVGVKSTFPTVHQVHEAVTETTAAFRVFYGSFMAPVEGIAGGAAGWVSGILNVALPSALKMWEATQAGDWDEARAVWKRELLPIKYLYTRAQLGPVSDLEMYRSILRMRGETAGHSRAPLLPLTTEQNGRLAELLEQNGLLKS